MLLYQCFLCSDVIHLTFEPVLRFLIKCLLSLATTPSIWAHVRHSVLPSAGSFSRLHCRCLEGYVIDTDTDTFTCEQDGHWFPERISCSPRKCPMPSNSTHIRVHGDDFRVNKQVSVSCAEGFTYEGADASTCQVRYCLWTGCVSLTVTFVATNKGTSCWPRKKNQCRKFRLHPKGWEAS